MGGDKREMRDVDADGYKEGREWGMREWVPGSAVSFPGMQPQTVCCRGEKWENRAIVLRKERLSTFLLSYSPPPCPPLNFL